MKYEYIPKFWNKYGEKGFKRLINNGFTAKNAHYWPLRRPCNEIFEQNLMHQSWKSQIWQKMAAANSHKNDGHMWPSYVESVLQNSAWICSTPSRVPCSSSLTERFFLAH